MIKKHGNRLLEYKHYFELPREKSKSKYAIDMWFFIPNNLHSSGYTSKDFLKDLSLYTRYKAPNLTLNSLTDFYNEKNPLFRLKTIPHIEDNREKIEYELKTLLNTLKVTTRQTIETLKAMESFSYFEAERNLKIQFNRLDIILKKLYEYYEEAPEDFNKIYQIALEGVSLRIEKTLYKLYKIFPNDKGEIVSEINIQRNFRESMGFDSIFTNDEENNGKTVYREHLIKKWSESIMYIDIESSKTQTGLKHIFLGSAAAIAMLLAGIITIVASRWWNKETLYWFITALVAYSLKDRFKDILKAIFLKSASTILSHRERKIVSPGNKRACGKSRERISFPSFNSLTREVKDLRFKLKDDLDIKQFQEEIIHYQRDVKLSTKKLYKGHSRLFGIKEIMRFDLRRLFYKMDKAKELCLIPENDTLIPVKGDREYHFNIIVKTTYNNKENIKRYRITANNKKIKAVEEV